MADGRAVLTIGSLKVTGYRSGIGNADRLLHSIETDGLIHPVLISTSRIVLSGERRVWAYQKLARPKIPVTYVRTMAELLPLLEGENTTVVGRYSKRRSEIAAHCSTIIDADLLLPRAGASGRAFSPIKMLTETNLLGIKDFNTVSGMVLAYRLAHSGLDEQDRSLGYKALDAADQGQSVVPIANELRQHLTNKYGIKKPTWRFLEYIGNETTAATVTKPRKAMSTEEQRQIINRTLLMLEGAMPVLDGIGSPSDDLLLEEVTDWRVRLFRAENVIKRTINALRERTAREQ